MVDQNKNIDFSQVDLSINRPNIDIDFGADTTIIPNPYADFILEYTPTAYYKLDETSGSIIVDSTTNGYNGTYIGPPISSVPLTTIGKSIEITGTQTLSFPEGPLVLGASQRTIELWFNKLTLAGTEEYLYFVGDKVDTQCIGIYLDATGIHFTTWGTDDVYAIDYSDQNIHVVVTYNGELLRCYVNGSEVVSRAISLNMAAVYHNAGTRDGALNYSGKIDDIALYDKTLTSYEIESHYSMGTSEIEAALPGQTYVDEVLLDTPYLYWEFEDISDYIVEDRSGNSNHGAMTGNWSSNEGISNSSIHAAGTTTKAIDSMAGDYDPMTCLEFWFKNISGGAFYGIFDKWISASSRWIVYGQTTFPSLWYNNASAMTADQDHANSSEWKHCVMQYESAYGLTKMYVNGIQQLATFAGNIFATAPAAGLSVSGYRYDTDIVESTSHFSGSIDAVAVYNTSMTSRRILEHYEIGEFGSIQTPEDPNYAAAYNHNKLSLVGADNTTFVNISSKMFALNTIQSSTSGTNVLTANEPIGDMFSIDFYRNSVGSWYDDDFTDATLEIHFVFKAQPGDITYQTGSWQYHRPAKTGDRIVLSLRKTLINASRVITIKNDIQTTEPTNVESSWIVDDFNGTRELTVNLVRDLVTGQVNITIKSDGIIRETITTTTTYTADEMLDGVVLFHHRNYLDSTAYEEINFLTLRNETRTAYETQLGLLDPVAYYKLDEELGSLLVDSTGNGNDGSILNGNVVHAQAPLQDGAYSMSIVDGRIQTNDLDPYVKSSIIFTVDNLSSAPVGKQCVAWFGPDHNIDSTYVAIYIKDGKLGLEGQGLEAYELTDVTAAKKQVALTADTGIVKLYIDGLEVASIANSLSLVYAFFGQSRTGTEQASYDIDEIAVYGKTLVNNEVRIISGLLPVFDTLSDAILYKNPIVYYKLDETSGMQADDSSGNGHDGVYLGNPALGEFNSINTNSVLLDDSLNQYITSTNHTDVNLDTFTVEVWIRPSDISTKKQVVSKEFNSNWSITISEGEQDKISFWLFDGIWRETRSSMTLNLDEWYHIVCTTTKGVDMRMYINGTLNSMVTGIGNMLLNNTLPIMLGARSGDPNIGGGFDGYMDEFALYGEVLTPDEVITHYDLKTERVENTRAFTLPYNLGRILTLEHDFQLRYELGYAKPVEKNYTLPFLSTREGVPMELHFHIRYQIEQVSSLVSSASPLIVSMLSADLGFSYSGFSLRYVSERVKNVESHFNAKYDIKLDDTAYNFSIRYKTNKELTPVTYSLEKNTYTVGLIKEKSSNFRLRSRVARVDSTLTEHRFRLRFDSVKSRPSEKNYSSFYEIDPANTYNKNFNIRYGARLVPNELDTKFTFNDTDLSIEIDITDLDLSAYKLFIDNGNRYLGYEVLTNSGQDILDKPVTVEYDYDLIIPTYTPATTEVEFFESDVKYYNGKFGWSQLESDALYDDAPIIFASSLPSMTGPRPYSSYRSEHDLVIYIPGHYVIDYTTVSTNQPYLYLIENSSNRVIRVGKDLRDSANTKRIVSYLPAGSFTIVPATLIYGDLLPGVPDTAYSVRIHGPDFGQDEEAMLRTITNHGHMLPETVDTGVHFAANSMTINLKNIDKDSSVSFAILNEDLSSIGVKYRSMFPRAELAELGYEAELVGLSANILRAKVRVPDSCCFGKKLTIDDFEAICTVPQLDSEKTEYVATVQTSQKYSWNLSYNADLILDSVCGTQKTAIMIYDDNSKSISVTKNLGESWDSIGSIFSIFDHKIEGIDHENVSAVSIAGSGGSFITSVKLDV